MRMLVSAVDGEAALWGHRYYSPSLLIGMCKQTNPTDPNIRWVHTTDEGSVCASLGKFDVPQPDVLTSSGHDRGRPSDVYFGGGCGMPSWLVQPVLSPFLPHPRCMVC